MTISGSDLQKILVTEPEQVDELIRKIQRCQEMGFDTEFDGPKLIDADMANIYRSTLVGMSFAFMDVTAYYVPIAHKYRNCPPDDVTRILKALEYREQTTWMHNAKTEYQILHQRGCPPPKKPADSMILMWLLGLPGEGKGGKASYGLKQLVKKHFGRARKDFHDTAKGRMLAELHPEEALDYAAWDAWDTLELGHTFWPEAEHYRLTEVFWNQEMPCVQVVTDMERAGMPIDTARLQSLYEELQHDLEELVDEWEFLVPGVDIGSSAQVSDHFFRKANTGKGKNLWPTKGVERGKDRVKRKNKEVVAVLPGRLRVNRDTMEAAAAHPRTPADARSAAQVRMDWSALEKNRSTYTLNLIASARQHLDGRLHCSFHQTGTRTGRFSSSNPNLQNIPVRTELGQRVKQAFIAPDGWVFLAADYSQVELRVLAHLTKKGYLFDAYTEGADVHQRTADNLGVERWLAKNLNFAIVYGAGPNKLAKMAKLETKEARRLLQGMKELMHEEYALIAEIQALAERRGFVRTAAGRMRRIPEFQAHDGKECQRTAENWKCEWCYEVSKAKRIAGNTPVQGYAGDIFKKAMVDIHRYFRNVGELEHRIYLVGQVHDEITLLAREDYVEDAAPHVQRLMESAVELRVPLVAEPAWGKTWADVK